MLINRGQDKLTLRRGKRKESKLRRGMTRKRVGKEEERREGVERGRGPQVCEAGGSGVVHSLQRLSDLLSQA
jgi:hypothetical protein